MSIQEHNNREPVNFLRFGRGRFGRRCFIAGLIVSLGGCSNIIKRGQSPDDQLVKLTEEAPKTKYVSTACRIYGMNFAKIEGIGMVINVDGTGSNPATSGQRENLIDELKSRGVEKPNSYLSSKNTSMVILQGMLPPAIRKGDRFDVQVKVLPKSETESLEHGYLVETRMRPMALLGRGVKQGHVTGYAKGNVLADSIYETRQDQPNQVRGWIFGGGVATEDRPIGLTMRSEHSVRTTTTLSRAINSRFKIVDTSGRKGVATPKNDKQIVLSVPDEYRHNIGRYLQVIMNIAYSESSEERVNRLDLLDQQMADASLCREASLRLEAFGKEGVPALKRALRHHNLEVKFHAAQALAYMGEQDGLVVLQNAAESEPSFRWHALTAMASINDVAAATAIEKLMHMESAETRYGAFRALRAAFPGDPHVKGVPMDDFFFHVVSSDTEPMLHFSRSLRPEMVCFGENQTVSDEFLFVEAGLTVKGDGDGTIRVTRFDTDGERRKVSTTQIPDLVRTLSAVGCNYSTMLTIFRHAKQSGQLNTRLVVNAVPRIGGRADDEIASDRDKKKSKKYFAGPMPEMFRTGDSNKKPVKRAQVEDLSSANEAKNKGKTTSRLSRMKGWFTGGE